MDTKSLKCSVFFNPTDGKKIGKNKSNNIKEQKKPFKLGRLSSHGKLFSITYVPEQIQNSPIKIVAHSGRNGILDDPFSGSTIEIEEFITPNGNSPGGFQINYMIDEQVRCKSCLEMKRALDYTFQKLYCKSFKLEANGEEGKVPSEMKQKRKSRRSQQCEEAYPQLCTTPVFKEIEETGPLMKFFCHLVRSATIDNMKKFSRDVEEKLSKYEMLGNPRKKTLKVVIKPNATQMKRYKIKKAPQNVDVCERCQSLQQAMYATVSKLYEEAGVKTDFPTVQTIETYAFLVYPNDAENRPICRYKSERRRRRHATSAPEQSRETRNGEFSKKQKPGKTGDDKRNDKKTEDEVADEENRKILNSRIRRHKAAFAASKYIHMVIALAVSFATIILIIGSWLTKQQSYRTYVILVTVALLFGCLYNAYLMVVNKSFSIKNYFIIPFCWVLLAFSNGKCDKSLIPNNVCDPNIHFMSHVYLFNVLLEYYIASGIHAVVVLEINQFQKISVKELFKYSVFNLPLLIIVIGYAIFRMIAGLRNRKKTESLETNSNPENSEGEVL